MAPSLEAWQLGPAWHLLNIYLSIARVKNVYVYSDQSHI